MNFGSSSFTRTATIKLRCVVIKAIKEKEDHLKVGSIIICHYHFYLQAPYS
jgi:hypothetical protein